MCRFQQLYQLQALHSNSTQNRLYSDLQHSKPCMQVCRLSKTLRHEVLAAIAVQVVRFKHQINFALYTIILWLEHDGLDHKARQCFGTAPLQACTAKPNL